MTESRTFDQLLALNQELRRRISAGDEFLALLAHELHASVSPMLEAFECTQRSSDDPQILRSRELIQCQFRRLLSLSEDLRDLSQLAFSKLPIRKEPVALTAILQEAVTICLPSIETDGHELVLDMPREPVMVIGDRTRLVRMVSKVLDNACKFLGGPGKIWVSASVADDAVTIRVRDDGLGISAEVLPGVFERFNRGDPSLRPRYGGLGISLYLVRSVVGRHGGTVTAHSEGTGKGSEIRLCLPRQDAIVPHEATEIPAAGEHQDRPLRILLVDDNVDSARTLSMLLKCLGHEASTAPDGWKALEAARTAPPDLVLLDIGLPGMDGFEVCRRMRQELALHRCLLLALTGYGQEDDRRRSLEAGFDGHLLKPLSTEQLKTVLQMALAKRDGN